MNQSSKLLHVVREGAGLGYPCGLAKLADLLGACPNVREHVLLLGTMNLLHEAQELGIEGIERLAAPFGSGLAGYSVLKRKLKQLSPIDIISCDEVGVLWSLERINKDAKKILWLEDVPLANRKRKWLCQYLSGKGKNKASVFVSNNILKNQLAAVGLPKDAIKVVGVGAGINRANISESEMLAAKQRWGVTEGATNYVVGLLSDHPDRVDVRTISLASGTVDQVLKREVPNWNMRVLLSQHHQHRRRATYLTSEFGYAGLLVQEAGCGRPWEIVQECDALVVLGEQSVLSLAWACKSGKPVLVENCPSLNELVGSPNEGVVFFDKDDLRKPAAKLTEWYKNPEERKKASAAAVNLGKNRFSAQGMREQFASHLKNLLNCS